MDTRNSTEDWVLEYLEWTQPDGWTDAKGLSAFSGNEAASATMSDEFVAELQDWMNLAPTMRVAGSAYRAMGAAGDASGGSHDMAGVDVLRDALLAALRTESDCLGLMQRVLDTGKAPRRMVKLASRALRHAERLLEDERCALRYLQQCNGWLQTRLASDAAPGGDWPHAIEKMAADVSALKGTVLAAQRH